MVQTLPWLKDFQSWVVPRPPLSLWGPWGLERCVGIPSNVVDLTWGGIRQGCPWVMLELSHAWAKKGGVDQHRETLSAADWAQCVGKDNTPSCKMIPLWCLVPPANTHSGKKAKCASNYLDLSWVCGSLCPVPPPVPKDDLFRSCVCPGWRKRFLNQKGLDLVSGCRVCSTCDVNFKASVMEGKEKWNEMPGRFNLISPCKASLQEPGICAPGKELKGSEKSSTE